MTFEYLEVSHCTTPKYEYAPKYTGELPPTILPKGNRYTAHCSPEKYHSETFEGFDRMQLIETLSELGWELISVIHYDVKLLVIDPHEFTVLMFFKREVK